MLRTKAIFERKTNDFQPRDCVIEKIIELTSQEYDAFSKNMLDDYDFIRNNIDLMYCDREGVYHCLLVVGEDRPDGILEKAREAVTPATLLSCPTPVIFLLRIRSKLKGFMMQSRSRNLPV
ncbi:hypothetical protein SAMN02745133_02550 [Desulforamulus putei DSM 12395]|uniref:Uncharacterized protein n=1 Tax=Desulforamulus putei DSM 12395 TaxID=1121429 RepID=A0A1M5BDB3_9FIRM|nr:hypothetical protein [Desulforamulus putei]SHF40405.1 hypothetical protein SAMN02745133_02550 [Desulforamulus putei DSM 12395]